MTAEQLRQKFPHASEAFIRQNAEPVGGLSIDEPYPVRPQHGVDPVRSKPSKWPDKDGCDNQLEADWLAHLRMLFCQEPSVQVLVKPFTLRLANRLSYTPDFMVTRAYSHLDRLAIVTFYETKGPHRFREKGIIKLKMAAKLHPWATWVLVERENGQWKETVV